MKIFLSLVTVLSMFSACTTEDTDNRSKQLVIPTCSSLGAPATLPCSSRIACTYEGQVCLVKELPDCSTLDGDVTGCSAAGLCAVDGQSCVGTTDDASTGGL